MQLNKHAIFCTEGIDDVIVCLQAWQWPGNVREPGNLVRPMVNLCGRLEINLHDLPDEMRQLHKAPPGVGAHVRELSRCIKLAMPD